MTRAGTRVSAGGTVSSTASRKALGEALDGQVADLSKAEPKSKAASSKGKPANSNQKKKKATGDPDAKQLRKDIKAFLVYLQLIATLL